MRYQAVNALPLRNFVSIASGFLLFCVGCAQTLLCVLLYAFSGSERAVPLRNFVSIASGFLLFRVGCAQTLLCVLLYAFSGSGRAVPLRNFIKRRGDSASFSIHVCRMCLKMRSFRAFYPNHFM